LKTRAQHSVKQDLLLNQVENVLWQKVELIQSIFVIIKSRPHVLL